MSFLPPPQNLILLVDITLYPTEKSGRVTPITGQFFDCQVWIYEEYRPFRILLEGTSLSPGQTRRYRVQFVSGWDFDGARQAEHFALFDSGIIGHCVVVPVADYSKPPA